MTPAHLQTAKEFLEAFCTLEELNSITWQTFDDSEHKSPGLVTVRAGKLETHAPDLERLNGEGAGVFWTVNPQTDPRKRNKGNTAQVRAVFTDLDGAPLEPVIAFALPPTAILESSPSRFHAYWKVSDFPLHDFEGLQKRLAEHFNGDPKVCDLPRVMRFPYFMHKKGEPFQTKILELHSERVYTLEQMNAALPQVQPTAPIGKPVTRASQNTSSSNDAARKYVLTALESERTILRNAPEGQGNDQINKSAFALGQLVGAGGLSESEVRDALEQAVSSWAKPDPSVAASIRSGLEAGKLEPRDLSDVGKKPMGKAMQNIGNGLKGKDSSKKPNSSSKEFTFSEQWDNYAIENGVIVQVIENTKGVITDTKPLCNFQARINAEVMRDDGAEQTAVFSLSGSLSTGEVLPTVPVPASQFSGMNWVMQNWGARPVVCHGQNTRDKLREGIQTRSLDTIESRTVFTHTGWRKLKGHGWGYLHAGGAIAADGNVSDLEIDLDKLENYCLPEPATGMALLGAVKASLETLTLAPDRVTLPLWLSILRVALGVTRFSVYLYGVTGEAKSGVAAMMLCHYGKFTRFTLPASWETTATTLERTLFTLKDAPCVIDDFNPRGSMQETKALHSKADRVLRNQGNGSARERSFWAKGGTLETGRSYVPRGLCIVTGEDIPSGQSLRARNLILEVNRGDVKRETLAKLNPIAESGILSAGMAAFLQWLAPNLEQHQNKLATRATDLALTFTASHGRTTDAAGDLLAALEIWGAFALEKQCITKPELEALTSRARSALQAACGAQAEHQAASDPVTRFLEILPALFSSGKAHLKDSSTGQASKNPSRWGWLERTYGTGENERNEWQPQGVCIGWLNEQGSVLLEPQAAYASVQRLAGEQGDNITKSAPAIWKAMSERGLIVKDKEQNTTRRRIEGSVKRVLCLQSHALEIEEEQNADPLPVSKSSHISHTTQTDVLDNSDGMTANSTVTEKTVTAHNISHSADSSVQTPVTDVKQSQQNISHGLDAMQQSVKTPVTDVTAKKTVYASELSQISLENDASIVLDGLLEGELCR